jgi:hypothetical protein
MSCESTGTAGADLPGCQNWTVKFVDHTCGPQLLARRSSMPLEPFGKVGREPPFVAPPYTRSANVLLNNSASPSSSLHEVLSTALLIPNSVFIGSTLMYP